MATKKTPPKNGNGKRAAAKKPVVTMTPKTLVHDPYEWIDKQAGIGSSDDMQVPERLIDQVIGQDQAVAVAEKAAYQKRNLLLIGDPGTGKSMIAKAMAEMLPPVQLDDVMVHHNDEDPNAPQVATVDAGEARKIVKETRALAMRKKIVRKTLEWLALTALMSLGVAGFFIEGVTLVTIMVFGIMVLVSLFLFSLFRQTKDETTMTIPKALLEYDPKAKNHTQYVDATGAHAGALLGDVRHDPFQSGGLETPTHERVEVGAIHKAHKGILFIDEINVLRLDSQQALLTAMQDHTYSIVGQSETSSGAMVKTAPVPCDFILVAAGNLDAVQEPDGRHTGMHPALRSRIRGYGYEIYVNSVMDDTHDNRVKLCRFVAQEVAKDGRIAGFEAHAIAEVILEAQRRSGHRGKLTLRLRELGGLVRTAGDVAANQKRKRVTADDVREAKRLSRSLEQQIAEQDLEARRDHGAMISDKPTVGMAQGAGLLGTGEVGEPAGMVVPVRAAVTPPLSRHGGHIGFGAGIRHSADSQAEVVNALLKQITGRTVADKDVHIQSVAALDGVDATGSGLALAVSALSSLEAVTVRQDTVLIGALSVTGNVEAVRGVTQQIESAVDHGYARVVVPKANANDIMLSPVYRTRVQILQVEHLGEVLDEVLTGARKSKLVTAAKKAGTVKVTSRA